MNKQTRILRQKFKQMLANNKQLYKTIMDLLDSSSELLAETSWQVLDAMPLSLAIVEKMSSIPYLKKPE